MTWRSIVAGVDGSPEGGSAAATAWTIAERARVPVHVVHAVPEIAALTEGGSRSTEVFRVREGVLDVARQQLVERLRGIAPEGSLANLDVRFGRAATVIVDVAREHDAELIVLGGKEHGLLARWFADNTAVDVVRLATVPTLVATHSAAHVARVLAAVDLSHAAAATIAVAERFAQLFDAELRVVHAIEPVPLAAELPTPVNAQQFTDVAMAMLEREVWPKLTLPAEQQVRHGSARGVIATEAADWNADLVVVGSHGKGWVDRILLGSVTEDLLRHLPTSLVVVPAHPAGTVAERDGPAVTAKAM